MAAVEASAAVVVGVEAEVEEGSEAARSLPRDRRTESSVSHTAHTDRASCRQTHSARSAFVVQPSLPAPSPMMTFAYTQILESQHVNNLTSQMRTRHQHTPPQPYITNTPTALTQLTLLVSLSVCRSVPSLCIPQRWACCSTRVRVRWCASRPRTRSRTSMRPSTWTTSRR